MNSKIRFQKATQNFQKKYGNSTSADLQSFTLGWMKANEINIKTIEEDLLKKYFILDKMPQYKIYEQLRNGNIKIFTDVGSKTLCSFILKISGIWETQHNYGLTYKFIKNDSTIYLDN